jgi:CBS domain-containing protein
MTVQNILKVKGHVPVVTVPPTATLAEVTEVLSSRRIGAVVVSQTGTDVQGILSERDIVRELGRRDRPACPRRSVP